MSFSFCIIMQTLVASHHCLTDDVSWYFNYLQFIFYQTFSTLTFKKKKKERKYKFIFDQILFNFKNKYHLIRKIFSNNEHFSLQTYQQLHVRVFS